MADTDRQAQIDKGLRRISDLIILARGARALTTAVALGVFDALSDGPKDLPQIASALKTDERATRLLLDALVSLELLGKDGSRYANVPVGQDFLVADAPNSLGANFRYQESLAHAWADLPGVVRAGKPLRPLSSLLWEDPSFTRHYIRGMANIARRPAAELANQLDLTRVRDMLDVGGGPGCYIEAVLAKATGARAVLLDLPPTLAVAGELLAKSAVRARIELRPGDYHEADFGREAFDLVLMSHITHDEGEAETQHLLSKAFAALRPGGQAVIHDFMLDADRTTPLFGALFSLHMLVYTPKGRTYSAEEYASWMSGCGFGNLRQIDICPQSPTASRALCGVKP